MAVMAPRESWTDERLDDLAKHMDARFDQVDARFDQVDARFDQVDARFSQIDARFSDLTRLMQMGLVIIGAVLTLITGMLAGLITLIVAQL
jgi:hypothetical protein